MGIKLIGGRDFPTEYSTDTSTYLINEAAARKIGYQEPVDKEVTMWNRKGKIIGLMKDYHYSSLHIAIEPLILQLQRGVGIQLLIGGVYWYAPGLVKRNRH